MAEMKTFNTRIKLRIDTLENWNSSSSILLPGEVAFATVAASAGTGLTEPVVMAKIATEEGKTFKDLPWAFYSKSSDVLSACKSEEALTAFINGVIANAGIATDDAMQELAGKVTTAEGKITTLEGKMTTAEGKITTAEGAIAALEGLVGDESVKTQIETYVTNLNLGGTYAAKVHTHEIADVNGLSDSIAAAKKAGTDANAALEAYKTLNDAAVKVNSDAITAIKNGETIDNFKEVEEALAGKQAAGNYSVEGHKHEIADVNGLSAAIEAAAKAGTDAASAAEKNAKDYADGLAGNYDEAGAADAALEAAKGYVDGFTGGKTVSESINAVIANYSTTEQMNSAIDTAKGEAVSHANGLNTAMDARVQALEAIDHTHTFVEAELNKIAEGDVEKWNAAEQNAKDYADGLDEAMDVRMQAIEAKFGEGEGNVESQIEAAVSAETEAREAADEALAADIKAISDDYLKGADKTALQDQIDVLDGLVGDETVAKQITDVTDPLAARVKAVEDDYLKAADKTELEGKITTNANAIERLTNGVSAEEVDGVNDLIAYVKEHGTEVTGIKGDIKANADAIDAIEADYLKAADKTELSGLITGLDTRMGAAETAIGTKASQADHEALAGRVTTVENDLNTETTGLKARLTQAETDIDALETKVGDETVAKQIEDAITALKIGDYAKAADLTAAIQQHNTDKAAMEAEIAKKANDADLAPIAKTGSTDDLVQGEFVIVFDCGNSTDLPLDAASLNALRLG